MFISCAFLLNVSLDLIFFGAIAIALADLSASILNSISDINIDSINRVNRPLVKGAIAINKAMLFF
jgi:4-hydroxybenzoate polyprenyltransferase